ncbi:hypothetical protein ACFLWI_02025 [Chloroflexota bacterium]
MIAQYLPWKIGIPIGIAAIIWPVWQLWGGSWQLSWHNWQLWLVIALFALLAWRIYRAARGRGKTEKITHDSLPNVVYESTWEKPFEGASYIGPMYKNDVACPAGDISISKHTRAKIEVFNLGGDLVHSWIGRWADNRWPRDYEDIDLQNQRDINPRDSARLDIGYRINGEAEFKAQYNWLPSSPEPQIKVLEPSSYYVRTLLWATHMEERESWFTLQIPNVPQSDDLRQVNLISIAEPIMFDKGDSRPE